MRRVQAALKLRRMSIELREQYALLKDQRDELQRIQLQKERLMAFVVHDLKNPVHSIDLHAQFLLRNGALPADLVDAATHIRSDVRDLTTMILNLLDLSKSDEGRLTPQLAAFDLCVLARAVAKELGSNATDRDVQLACEIDVGTIRADEGLVRRMLVNLVENALRHAPPGSRVRMTAIQDEHAVTIRVVDAGAGVSARLRDSIFDPFVQAATDDAPPSHGGRGLGLAFCKMATLAHGGTIWVEDAGPGAIFCVRLPDVR